MNVFLFAHFMPFCEFLLTIKTVEECRFFPHRSGNDYYPIGFMHGAVPNKVLLNKYSVDFPTTKYFAYIEFICSDGQLVTRSYISIQYRNCRILCAFAVLLTFRSLLRSWPQKSIVLVHTCRIFHFQSAIWLISTKYTAEPTNQYTSNWPSSSVISAKNSPSACRYTDRRLALKCHDPKNNSRRYLMMPSGLMHCSVATHRTSLSRVADVAG